MSDYDELIKRLRDAAKMSEALAVFLPKSEGNAVAKLYSEAADAIEELSKPRWIPVSERLPDGIALAVNAMRGSYGYLEYLIGYIYKDEESDSGYSCESAGETLMNVTHWQPLPEPPKEASHE